MKKLLTFASALVFLVCPAYSQNKPAKLKIDKVLKNNLFEVLPFAFHAGPNRIYLDSVLVYSNDSSEAIQYISNADIIDIQSKDRAFDTCRSYFFQDTLIIEFVSIFPIFTDKLVLKIKNRKYWAYLVNEGANIRELGKSKSLIFKNKIKKKGQEIFGELLIDFPNEKVKQSYTFYGPFRCIVK